MAVATGRGRGAGGSAACAARRGRGRVLKRLVLMGMVSLVFGAMPTVVQGQALPPYVYPARASHAASGRDGWSVPDSVLARTYAKEGALVGALTTGLIGVGVGAAFCSVNEGSSGGCFLGTLLFGLAGTVPGLVVGGLIGSGIRRD